MKELLKWLGIGEKDTKKHPSVKAAKQGPYSWADEFGGVTEEQKRKAEAAAKEIRRVQAAGPTRKDARFNIKKPPFGD